MTAVNPTQTTCPACSSIYVTALESGTFFCAECRHEWDPAAKAKPPAPEVTEPARPLQRIDDPPADFPSESFVTFVDVEHDDGGSGNFDAPAITTIEVDDDTAGELEGLIAQTDADAEAYLVSLVGTMVTLEGGQRATIIGFEDDDRIAVQFANGEMADVEFNDVISADSGPPAGEIVEAELDDETAEAFGTGSLLFACMVIEAGVASIEGDGAEAHLVESPTGWFIVDEDAVPLMELASAAAVAMLILSFGIPKADIAEWIAKIRSDALAARSTEVQGHDEHPDDNENGSDAGAAD